MENLQSFLKGTDIAQFTAEEKMKMGYYAHLAIHNDIGVGSKLMEELTLNITSPDQITERIDEITNHYWFDGVGLPLYANTYRKYLTPSDDEQGELMENSPVDPNAIPQPKPVVPVNPNTNAQATNGGAPSRL